MLRRAMAAETRPASRTAVGVALLRAIHQLRDGTPRILDDPVAAALVGPDAMARALAAPDAFQSEAMLALRAHVVLRSRFAENCAAAAAARGVRQLVVLGAGFDSFAYRQPRWAAGLRIYEVDHPESQRLKRERLAAASIAIPANVAHVPAELLRCGFASVGFLEPEEAERRYFGRRSDGLLAPPRVSIARALT